jgi:hypothetical protein
MSKLRTSAGTGYALSITTFALSVGVSIVVAVAMNDVLWHSASYDSLTQNYGLFDVCLRSPTAGRCESWTLSSAISTPDCPWSDMQVVAWAWGTRAAAILGGASSLIGGVSALGGAQRSLGAVWPFASLAAHVLALLAIAATCASWFVVFPLKLYCGTVCDHLRAQGTSFVECSEKRGLGLWLMIGAGSGQVIVTGLAVATLVLQRLQAAREAASREPISSESPLNGAPPPTSSGPPAASPTDDWEHDEDTGYEYSVSRGMYLDKPSGRVYDPNADQWRLLAEVDGSRKPS